MDSPFLNMEAWLELDCPDADIARTFGRLLFKHGKNIFTAHIHEKNYQETANLPAYPLAWWIAQCWWRLLYESKPVQEHLYEWDMTHCMRFSGYGFLWPDIWFCPDGVGIDIIAQSYRADEEEPIEYLSCKSEGISVGQMEMCFSDFITSTLERVGDEKSGLALLWNEVLKERNRKDLTLIRKIEAVLGCDPDSLPEAEVNALVGYRAMTGEDALLDVLTAFRQNTCETGVKPVEAMKKLIGLDGMEGAFQGVFHAEGNNCNACSQPWDIGRRWARKMRQENGIQGKVSNETLRSLLGISKKDFDRSQNDLPFFIGKRHGKGYIFSLLKDNSESRRFQLARYLGEYCFAVENKDQNGWLVSSDCSTFRQKVQRAFGAEFLLPVDLITEHTDGVYMPRNVKKVAEDFGVSSLLAASQLANHKLIPSSQLELYS